MSSAAEPEFVDAPDPAIAETEACMEALRRLTDMAMEIADAVRMEVRLEHQAYGLQINRAATPAEVQAARTAIPTKARDVADAFARISKAIRFTIGLRLRTQKELSALIADEPLAREERRKAAAERSEARVEAKRKAQVDKVGRLVMEAADRQREYIHDIEIYDELEKALDERLEDDEAYADLDNVPIEQVVRRICKDLCIEPDWSLWDGDRWRKAPFTRPPHSQYRLPSRRRIRWDEDRNGWTYDPPQPEPAELPPPPANDLTPVDPAEDEIVYWDPAPSIRRDSSGFS